MSLILYAATFAAESHAGQLRKYTGRPYIEHPMRVAGYTSLLPNTTEQMVAAAWLHDVIEDCGAVCAAKLQGMFAPEVFALVTALTNPSKQFKHLPRAERKEMDRKHLASCCWRVKAIKLLDRADNVREMVGAPPDFKERYLHESLALAAALLNDHPAIKLTYQRLIAELQELSLQLFGNDNVVIPELN